MASEKKAYNMIGQQTEDEKYDACGGKTSENKGGIYTFRCEGYTVELEFSDTGYTAEEAFKEYIRMMTALDC